MVLHFRKRINKPGKVGHPAEEVRDVARLLSLVSNKERWDVAIELRSQSALMRACRELQMEPETYCSLKIRPKPGVARELALDLFKHAQGGPIEITGGTQEEPCHILATLRSPLPRDLDSPAYNPQLTHLQASRDFLTLSEREMHRRFHVPAIWRVKERIQRSYEAAAKAAGHQVSFEDWSRVMMPPFTRARDRVLWSSEIGEFPYNVGVKGDALSESNREVLLGQWLELMGHTELIELELLAPFGEFSQWMERLSQAAEKVTASTWGLNTARNQEGPSRDRVLGLFEDERIAKQLRKWDVRCHHIGWKLSDPGLVTDEGENAIVLVQEPREFHRTVHVTFPIEDMDSPRFYSAISELQFHIALDLHNEVSWWLEGDPASTSRGHEVARLLGRLRALTKEYFEQHPLGPSSAPLFDSRGKILRGLNARQKGEVSFKDTIVRMMNHTLPEFEYNESTSWVERGMLDFVRRNESGTRDLIVYARDKYGGSFGVDAAVSPVPCAEVHLGDASADPADVLNPTWGLRGLSSLMNHNRAGPAWTWIYEDQKSFETGLNEASGRIKTVLLPLFDTLEPTLLELRALARR